MEASDTAGQEPTQEPGSTGQDQGDQVDGSQDQGSGQSGDNAQVSQETPQQDSGLQTPQADQPVPSESERDGQGQETQPDTVGGSEASPGPSGEPAEGDVGPAREAPRGAPVEQVPDQAADAVAREDALEDSRTEHNERTGGGEVKPNEVQNSRQEHNNRTGGGEVPGAGPSGE